MSIKKYFTSKNVIETAKYLGSLAAMVLCRIFGGKIIKNWAFEKNCMLTNRIEWLSKKMELYFKAEELKTLDLANAVSRLSRSHRDKRSN